MSAAWEIIGHDWAVDHLQTALRHGRIGHAYLITGPERVGRGTLARALARALNCTGDSLNQEPCGVCRACSLIAAGRHPDVRLLEPEITGRGNAVIRIDQIRELQRDLNLAAVEGRYKIAIIHQFETANANAANAFLKTLEEPPPRVVLILTATDADALLPTITSRCRTLNLRPVNTLLIAHHLETQLSCSPAEARRLAHLANGRIGWAIEAASGAPLADLHEERLGLLREALDERRVGRFALADQLAGRPEELPALLQTWASFWRDAVLLGCARSPEDDLINIEALPALEQVAAGAQRQELLANLRRTEEALWQLERNGNIRLVLENLLLSYPLPEHVPHQR